VQEFCHFFSEDIGVSLSQKYEAEHICSPYYGSSCGEAVVYKLKDVEYPRVTPKFEFQTKPEVEELRSMATDFYKKIGAYPFLFVLISSDEPNPRYAIIMTGGGT